MLVTLLPTKKIHTVHAVTYSVFHNSAENLRTGAEPGEFRIECLQVVVRDSTFKKRMQHSYRALFHPQTVETEHTFPEELGRNASMEVLHHWI